MKAAELVIDVENKQLEAKKELAKREIEKSLEEIRVMQDMADRNKSYLKRLKKEHKKLLDRDIKDFEESITFHITDWKLNIGSAPATFSSGNAGTLTTTDMVLMNPRA